MTSCLAIVYLDVTVRHANFLSGRTKILKYALTCRYDTGPILAQAVVPVSPTDSPVQLAARVLKEVTLLLPA